MKSTSAIGVDLGSRTIKAVQLLGGRLRAAILFAMPADATQLPHLLRETLFRHGFAGDRIVLAAPIKQLEVDTLELPPRSSGAPVEQIARMELARTAKLEAEPFELSCWDLPTPARAASGTAMMAVALRHSHAAALLDPLEAEGFNVVAIDSAAWALTRACKPYHLPGSISAVLDIGFNSALVVLVRDGVVIYQRVFADSGLGMLYRSLQQDFQLGHDEADYVLATLGIAAANPDDPSQTPRIRKLIGRHLDALLEEIQAAFQYALHRYADTPVKNLLLVGGGSSIAGVNEFLAAKLNLEVKTLAPAGIVQCPQSLTAQCGNGLLTMALGLAQHGK